MPAESKKTSICVIPARGGSKRIPGKNIRPFAGRPMIAYPIEVALQSGLFERVIVSTDSVEIAGVAAACGAEVPFMRPAELADDHTVSSAVLVHALEWLRDQDAMPDFFCCIYPTAPFLRQDYLREGHELLREGKAEAAFSVTTYPFPIQRSLKINERGRTEFMWPEHTLTRSQDLPEAYHDAGQFYWYRADAYLRGRGDVPGGPTPVILPRYLVQDIDTPEDWETAEMMFSALKQQGKL